MSSFVKLRSPITDGYRTFLIDTGADISIFKENLLKQNVEIKASNSQISGIGKGTTTTSGIVETDMIFENIYVPIDFHLVPQTFPIPCAGIIGADFLKKYKCSVDFEKNLLFVKPEDYHEVFAVPLHESPQPRHIILPARSEVFRKVHLKTEENEVFIPGQEIYPGVFTAKTVVSKSSPYVKILNLNSDIVTLIDPTIETESLTTTKPLHCPRLLKQEKVKLWKNFQKISHNWSQRI